MSSGKPTFFSRKVDAEKMDAACSRLIDVLRKELKLEPYECYFVVENLYKTFPVEDLIE